MLCLGLGDNQLSLIQSSKTASDVWLNLEKHYEVKSLINNYFYTKGISLLSC